MHQKPDQMEETCWEGQNCSEVVVPQEEEEEEGSKKQADNDQKPLGMEEDCIVGRGRQWNVVLEKAKNSKQQ